MTAMDPSQGRRLKSGIPGLDDVLGGGFPEHRVHLVQGTPGTGKTTIGLHFLREGLLNKESVLYITLSETAEELRMAAASHGWDLSDLTIRELTPGEDQLSRDAQYTMFHPTDIELGETTWAVLEEVARTNPTRVVFDSLAELRLLAGDPLRYRREIMGLKQFFAGRHCTVLLLDSDETSDGDLASVAHSVLHLDQLTPEYGTERRRLRVLKLRGGRYRGGLHDFIIATGGITVFPRLIAAEHDLGNLDQDRLRTVSSGVQELDDLLGDGLHRGTSALFIGPAGVGKTVLSTQFVHAAAHRGEPSAVYVFDEAASTHLARSKGLGLDIAPYVESGLITMQQLEPSQLSPGEFIQQVRKGVEQKGVRLLVIDSLNGYLNAMAEEHAVLVQLHELLMYLNRLNVLTILTVAQHGLLDLGVKAPLDVSYLADTVVLLRYFEAAGRLRQAISVVKKRTGSHEHTIRELMLGPGVQLGAPLAGFQGVLSGNPTFLGAEHQLLAQPAVTVD